MIMLERTITSFASSDPLGYDAHEGWSDAAGSLYSAATTGITQATCLV